MKKLIIISTFILLLMATPAFCGGNFGRALGDALPKALDDISKMQQMEMQEREMRLREQESKRLRNERHEMTDYKCMNDCFDAGYSFFSCTKTCSY